MRLPGALAIALLLAALSAPAGAQDTKLEVRSNDTVRTVLERQVRKRRQRGADRPGRSWPASSRAWATSSYTSRSCPAESSSTRS